MNMVSLGRVGLTCVVLCSGLAPRHVLAQPEPGAGVLAPATAQSHYIRVVDDDKNRIVMQVAARTFSRVDKDGKPAAGPEVTMCAAVHIGDQPFYDQMQQLLDAKDVVLFESVKPAGTGRPEHDAPGANADEQRVKTTKMRVRVLGIAARAQKAKAGEYPKTIADLVAQVSVKMRPYLDGVTKDAWGRDLGYELKREEIATEPAPEPTAPDAGPAGADQTKPAEPPTPPTPRFREVVEVISLGADGKPGGEGFDADLQLSAQKPIKASEIPRVETKGLQSLMADAMGLVFQLDAMTHEHANWRNSDLAVDQLQDRISGAGGDAQELFDTLDGRSMGAWAAKLVLGLMKLMPSVQTMGKVAMIEMLGRAEELIDSVPGMEHMMQVIIKDRNAVVLDDLSRIIENEPGVKTVGIIYGGGHMPDLEKRLADMGYRETGVQWVDAIAVPVPKSKADAKQLRSIRQMVRDALDQQVKAAAKKKPRKAAPEE